MKNKVSFFLLGAALATIVYSVGTLTAQDGIGTFDVLHVNKLTVHDDLILDPGKSDTLIGPSIKLATDKNGRAILEVKDHKGVKIIQSDSITELSPAQSVAKMIREELIKNYRIQKVADGFMLTPKEGSETKPFFVSRKGTPPIGNYTFSFHSNSYLVVAIKGLGIATFKMNSAGDIEDILE